MGITQRTVFYISINRIFPIYMICISHIESISLRWRFFIILFNIFFKPTEALSILKNEEDEGDDTGLLCGETSQEKEIYELQLSQLQEQLVAAMIENQNLSKYRTLFWSRQLFKLFYLMAPEAESLLKS